MALTPQMRELGIVVVGDFNPAILHPSWLVNEKLIRPVDASEAKVEVVHKDLAAFELPWARVDATGTRLHVKTSQEPYFKPVRDLVTGILGLLEHTPVRAVGINWGHYYSLPNRAAYDDFGHALLPKALWEPALKKPGTLRAAVREAQSEGLKGYIDSTISISDKFQHCIYMFINDHNEVDANSKTKTAAQVNDLLLSEKWDSAEARPFALSESMFKNVNR